MYIWTVKLCTLQSALFCIVALSDITSADKLKPACFYKTKYKASCETSADMDFDAPQITIVHVGGSSVRVNCVCVTGKLGHGDTNRVYRPKVIEALHGFIIRKVCAGSQSSLALTSAGQVYTTSRILLSKYLLLYTHINSGVSVFLCVMQVFAWGCGSCLGCGSSETTSLRPRLIEELSITKIIDISCGDSHCLALSHGKRDGVTEMGKVMRKLC